MYNRHARNYNPYRKRRHARVAKNPTATNYIGAQPDSFNSISAARAFLLQHTDPCNIDVNNRELVKKIRNAKRVVRRADRRNLRRRVKSAVKRLIASKKQLVRRNPDEAPSCDACGMEFDDYVPEQSCSTCGREVKDPQQEYEEALHSLFEASMQSITSAEQSVRDAKNMILRYARQAAKSDDGEVIDEVLQQFQRAVDESGEHGNLPEGTYLEDDFSEEIPAFERSTERPALRPTIPAGDVGLHSWERVIGPEGEVITFKITRNGNKVAVSVDPRPRIKNGDIILDLTRGIEAFQFQKDREIPVGVTRDMRNHYEGSYLYKVRKLASGWRHASFVRAMKKTFDGKEKPAYAKSRRIKKRKK